MPTEHTLRLRVGQLTRTIAFHGTPLLMELLGERGVPFAAWLYRISHARVIDHWRATNRHPTVPLDSLSEQIGMVTQETHLFHDTIRTNLLYARLDASPVVLS